MPQPGLSDVHVDRAVSNVAIRYTNPLFIADQIAPVVPVAKESDKYFKFTKADWFRDNAADDRAPGTRAPRSGYALSTETYSLKEKAHATPVPDRIQDNADDPLRPFEDAANFTMQMVMLRKERDVASTYFTSGVWGTDNTPGTLWSAASSTPAEDVDTAKDTVLQNTGRIPNTLILGHEVWRSLRRHADALDAIKHTRLGVMSLDLLAQWLDIERVVVGSSIYNTAAEGQAASMSYVWGKHALVCYVPNSPSITEPAAAYTFQKTGVETKVYREEAEAQDVVEASVLIDPVVTASDAGYMFNSVVA